MVFIEVKSWHQSAQKHLYIDIKRNLGHISDSEADLNNKTYNPEHHESDK